MQLLLAGASGLIGSALARSLRQDGHDVITLVRRSPSNASELEWDPGAGRLDTAALESIDSVVCLSGAGVGDHRWTPRYKKALLDSRIQPVSLLAESIRAAAHPPATFVVASAVGYYGDTGDRVVDESSPSGAGFLARLCRQWEAAATPATEAGVRVANLRTGLVLSSAGGLLARLRPLFRLGIGGRLGDGRQYLSWIALLDEIAAIRFVIGNPALSGPVNLTGPQPVTNAEFTTTLARVMHRPALLPAPAPALRLVLGEFAQDILTGQRAMPRALQAAGFEFRYPNVQAALRDCLD